MEYGFTRCRTALSASRLPGLDYSLNPYFGCEHGCLYCYSGSVFRDEKIARSWGTFVKAKTNIAELLARELKAKRPGTIGLSTVTDPYQPYESKLELTRNCLKMLAGHHFKVSIQTKSSLALRDLDIVTGPRFEVGVTITTMDRDLARRLEPKASPPEERQQVIESYSQKKVETWIFLGPIIPYVNDQPENIEKIIHIAEATDSRLLFDKLNLRPWVLEKLTPFLARETPQAPNVMTSLLAEKSEYWRTVSERIRSLCRDHDVRCEPAFPNAALE
jgi:DNA repair photolyase